MLAARRSGHPIVASLTLGLLSAVLAAGLQWSPETSGVMARLRGVSALSDHVAWASGSGSTVLRTEDGGQTWRRLTVTADRLDFRDIDAVGPRTAYVLSIGNGPDSRIYKTTDAGARWDLQFTNPDPKAFYDAMSFWDARHGVAVSDSVDGQFVVLTTADGGGTWDRVPAARLPPALPNEGCFAASGTNVAVVGRDRVWIGTGAAEFARVLRSVDGGRTWRVATTPIAAGPSAGIYSVAFRDALHGVVVGGDYAKEREAVDNVAVTSDGGLTWTLAAGHGVGGFRSVVAHVPGTPTTWLAVGPSGADLSTDDGRSWTPIEGPGFDAFSFAPDGHVGWGTGSRGRIARLDSTPGRAGQGRATLALLPGPWRPGPIR
jgi:photosystem II stability/assembly factor-like uncharacterized protein